MKYVDEFRDRRLIDKAAEEIRKAVDKGRTYNIMEVCGTHTMSVFRFGLKGILPANIRLISGPGCPVCVTPNEFIDKAIAIANMKAVIIATFGDMLKVPGSRSSLEKEKASGADIRIVYSSIDALDLARQNPKKEVVFLGIGFETTAPTIAQSILAASREHLKNYSVLCGHKTMPEVLKTLVADKITKIDSFLLPGHVSAVIGSRPYQFLSKKYRKNCVICGFEPTDILQSILMIIKQKMPKVDIQYDRIIERCGNKLAQRSIEKVFQESESTWRGFGILPKSGLKIRREYKDFDAQLKFRPKIDEPRDNTRCFCGYILKGVKTPYDCPSFAKTCTPENPAGACMVSSEGTCAAYYRFGK